MKKAKFILLSICALFLALTIGIFIGRNTGRDVAWIPVDDAVSTELYTNKPTDARLDINEMSKAQIMALPGIGETLADRIVAYREENGAFKVIEDILNVDGIGEKKLEQIAYLVKVGG